MHPMKAEAGTETSAGTTKSKRTSGRKDGNKQEAVADETILDKGMPNVVELMKKCELANEELSEAVQGLAEKSGFFAKVVRALGRAKLKDNVGDKKREIGQMSLAFGLDE